MAENKTKPTNASVRDFIAQIESEQKRKDTQVLIELFEKITGAKAVLWGPSIIGFGQYHYKYESGREGDFMLVGFSPRKANLSLYIMAGFSKYDHYLEKLGKFKRSKACLYIKRLSDIDFSVLSDLVEDSVKTMREKYPD